MNQRENVLTEWEELFNEEVGPTAGILEIILSAVIECELRVKEGAALIR